MLSRLLKNLIPDIFNSDEIAAMRGKNFSHFIPTLKYCNKSEFYNVLVKQMILFASVKFIAL